MSSTKVKPETPATVEEKIVNLASEHGNNVNHTVSVDSKLDEDLAFDELDLIEFIMELEEEFDIEIPDGDQDPLLTVQDWVLYIVGRLEI